MSKRIEEELAEMSRLKKLEFLFFKDGMDNSVLKKYHDAQVNEETALRDTDSELQYA